MACIICRYNQEISAKRKKLLKGNKPGKKFEWGGIEWMPPFSIHLPPAMKQEPKVPYRFYRPRRPEGMGAGLRLDGVTNIFGLVGITFLILVGIAMLMVRNSLGEKDLEAVEIIIQAPPYFTPKLRNSILLSITGARVMALEPASYAAADTAALMRLRQGDVLKAWMPKKEAQKWNEGLGRKDFYRAMLLQKSDGNWIVNHKAYQKKAQGHSSQGWWLILLGLILIPYQVLRNPKIPVWLVLGVYILVLMFWILL